MAQLSRRSKDNATDLISLKEATNARDEDIRKSLRELGVESLIAGNRTWSGFWVQVDQPSEWGYGSFLLDNKPHASPLSMRKNFSYQGSRARTVLLLRLSKNCRIHLSYGVEGAASLAMLEKIIREMGTKEGQNDPFHS
jgi:hypothetical protein